MTTGKQAYTEYVEAQFVEPEPSTTPNPAGVYGTAQSPTMRDLKPSPAPSPGLQDVRELLEAIIIRCTEGDKRSDWLPIIERSAREALAALAQSDETPRLRNEVRNE